MVSGPDDTTGYIPLDLGGDTGVEDLPTTPSGADQAKGIPSIGGGAGAIEAHTVAALIAVFMPVIAGMIAEVGLAKPPGWVNNILKHPAANVDTLLSSAAGKSLWSWMKSFVQVEFMTPLLEDGLGIPVPSGKGTEQAVKGMKLIDSMVSFALGLEFSVLLVQHVGKAILGNRWPEALSETLGKLPEIAGLSWALGLVIDRTFEAAFGESLNNYIRAQVRPNKPEWQIARMMLKQHVISDDQLDEVLKDAGFPNEWIEAIKKLETNPLPIGDIQALYQQGLIDGGQLDDQIKVLGFTPENASLLKDLYITKAETASGAELRSVWRTLYRDGLVGEGEYRSTLESINFPKRLIDDDVKAATDERNYGWRVQNVGVIKSEFLHHSISADVAAQKLQTVGYSHTDAQSMVSSWTAPPIRRQQGLTESQILRYYMAKLLDRSQAQTDLMALGLDASTVGFLLDHPSSASGAHPVKLTPALVTQAYLSGAIKQSQLADAYKKAGAEGEALQYLVDTATYKYAKVHHIGTGDKPLGENYIKEAFKLGLWDEGTAQNALVTMGYSAANANLILEIENKGPFKAAGQPAFPNLAAAESYLEGLGIKLLAPISPVYEAAVSMVEMAGFGLEFPPNFHPP